MKSFLLKLTAIACIFFFLGGCNRSGTKREQVMSESDTTMQNSIASIAARENKNDSLRKFIRTADLKFKVKDAIHSTADIEDITIRHGGFVNYTKLASNTDYTTHTTISRDSSIERVYFTLANQLVLRIPNNKLDTTLKEIARLVDVLDHRIITADDVALQILSNNINQKRIAKSDAKLSTAINKKPSKLNELVSAEDSRLANEETGDNAKLANLALKDKINYSTVNIQIYQDQSFRSKVVAIEPNLQDFEPGLGSRILTSFNFGWKILEGLMVMVVNLWSIILLVVILLLVFRKKRFNYKISK